MALSQADGGLRFGHRVWADITAEKNQEVEHSNENHGASQGGAVSKMAITPDVALAVSAKLCELQQQEPPGSGSTVTVAVPVLSTSAWMSAKNETAVPVSVPVVGSSETVSETPTLSEVQAMGAEDGSTGRTSMLAQDAFVMVDSVGSMVAVTAATESSPESPPGSPVLVDSSPSSVEEPVESTDAVEMDGTSQDHVYNVPPATMSAPPPAYTVAVTAAGSASPKPSGTGFNYVETADSSVTIAAPAAVMIAAPAPLVTPSDEPQRISATTIASPAEITSAAPAGPVSATSLISAALAGAAAGASTLSDVASTIGNNYETSEANYDMQMTQLSDMGFFDVESNIQLLQEMDGDVNRVIERLLA